MPRRWIRFICFAISIAFLIFGCQKIYLDGADSNHSVTLRLSGWGAGPTEQRLLQQVLDDFAASHPHINVKLESIADQYMDVIKTRLIGDAAPDVFYLDSLEAPFLMTQNVLEPLNTYIQPGFEIDDFEENLLNTFKLQDKIYGLPKDYSTLALYFNKEAFTKAGISEPPRTWEALRDTAKQLTVDRNQDGKPEQYGFGITPELPRLAYLIQAFNGEIIDRQGYARFAGAEGLTGLATVIDQYQADRTAARALDVGANSGSEMFGQGKAAMVFEGNWAIPFLQDTFPKLEFGTAELPTVNDKPGTMVFTVAYVMNRQTAHKQEAWELIAYLTGKEGMEKWTGTGFALPSRKSVARKLKVDQDPLRSALVAGVKYAMPWQVGKYPAVIVNSFNNQFMSAMLGEQPLAAAMQQAQQSANAQIRSME